MRHLNTHHSCGGTGDTRRQLRPPVLHYTPSVPPRNTYCIYVSPTPMILNCSLRWMRLASGALPNPRMVGRRVSACNHSGHVSDGRVGLGKKQIDLVRDRQEEAQPRGSVRRPRCRTDDPPPPWVGGGPPTTHTRRPIPLGCQRGSHSAFVDHGAPRRGAGRAGDAAGSCAVLYVQYVLYCMSPRLSCGRSTLHGERGGAAGVSRFCKSSGICVARIARH